MTSPTSVSAGPVNYRLSATASFAVSNGKGTVHGTIPVTSAVLTADSTGRPIRLAAALDPTGIATGIAKRDSDLQKKRFLSTVDHPAMTFTADHIEVRGSAWTCRGTLTVRGVSRSVVMQVVTAPDGRSAQGSATFDRRDFGIRAPKFVIGAAIAVTLQAQLVD